MIIPPYRICLSGGGIKGFAHIGVLETLQEHGLLKAVHEYLGISAGALCAFCLAIGCSLPELRRFALLLDFGLIRDVDPETALNFSETFRIDTGANVKKLLSAILRGKKLDPECTFAELETKKLGPSLRVFATNINTCRAEEFSAKATPGIEIRFAVQASLSIPIYFTPMRHPESGHLFLDGGLMCSSPFIYLSDEDKITALSVAFGDDHKPRETVETIYEFVSQLYYSTDYEHSRQIKTKWSAQTIIVPCGSINTVDFEASQESKEEIMTIGRDAARIFLTTPVKTPVRRFSLT